MSEQALPRAIIFDLMGTCLDWHTSVMPTLMKELQEAAPGQGLHPPSIDQVSTLALDWRQGFFDEIHARFEAGESQEDIDATHDRVLRRVMNDDAKLERQVKLSEEALNRCVAAWHTQEAWPDVTAALPQLRSMFDVVVLANGTSRLQIDITKSSGLDFDLLLSSELLGLTKPDPAIYQRAMTLLKRDPTECIMVAAHAYDLRAARKVGMRTVYLQRWTEDLQEDMAAVEAENDVFIDSRTASAHDSGLLQVADMLGAARVAAP